MNENNFVQSSEASQRQMRVQEILRAALNEILVRGETKNYILDENIITITHVDVSPDLRNAKFLFIPSDTKQIARFIDAFNSAKKIIRKKIAEKVQLKYVPEISFHFDESIDEIEKLEKIFSSEKVKNDTRIK